MSDLFNEFDPVSSKQWKQQIQADLKGADYNQTLVWQSPEGIHVKPFYHPDTVQRPFPSIPGQPNTWQIAQSVFIDDAAIANSLSKNALERGAQAIYFKADNAFNIQTVFDEYPFGDAAIYLNLSFLSEAFLLELSDFFRSKNATVHYNIDLIGNLARTGNWFQSLKEDHKTLFFLSGKKLGSHLLGIDASLYQNAGATIVQQLAYSLAHANEYLNHFKDSTSLDTKPTFTVAVGSNYFFEIAKIRALRVLYATLAREYGATEECHIVATPSFRNKTLYDYNTNMLRTTTECMSAILGGANSVMNLPYDSLYHKSNEFGERIARNQLLVLKEESYFNTVSNAAEGTYYIETLTQELAEKALEVFKEIEKGGGFLAQLKSGTIQRKIKESAQKEQDRFDSGEITLVGTNYHPNASDSMKNDLELYPFRKMKTGKTLLSPIVPTRLAEKAEQERLEREGYSL
jgi:methylmalonyl-CoA mutase